MNSKKGESVCFFLFVCLRSSFIFELPPLEKNVFEGTSEKTKENQSLILLISNVWQSCVTRCRLIGVCVAERPKMADERASLSRERNEGEV